MRFTNGLLRPRPELRQIAFVGGAAADMLNSNGSNCPNARQVSASNPDVEAGRPRLASPGNVACVS